MADKIQTTRTHADYAIEFGRYLVTAAERYMQAVNNYLVGNSLIDVDAMSDAWSALQSAIGEFQKRADRAEGKRP